MCVCLYLCASVYVRARAGYRVRTCSWPDPSSLGAHAHLGRRVRHLPPPHQPRDALLGPPPLHRVSASYTNQKRSACL